MITSLLYYLLGYLFLGGIGFYLASRKADQVTQRQRWLKYVVYILIVCCVLLSIAWHQFTVVAVLIIATGLWDAIRASTHVKRSNLITLVAMTSYSLIALGFLIFSLQFEQPFLYFTYFQVLSFDAFSQVMGQLFGKHPLMPQISPQKTWEGLVGGVIFCAFSAVLARHWIEVSLLKALLLGGTTAFLALLGDTLASYFKRLCQIKDYGTYLPGHGGCLDRFDSFMVVGMGYACLAFLGLW